MHYICTASRQRLNAWCRERGLTPRSPHVTHIGGHYHAPLGIIPEHDDEIIYLHARTGSEDDAAYAASLHLKDRQKPNPVP